MNVKLNHHGTFILAISGGVDSIVMLDLLAKSATTNQKLIVAHLDHGIRPDSYLDMQTVKAAAKASGLAFKLGKVYLGTGASEDLARRVRYQFLREIKDEYQADAIITAHHQDDLIETAIINMLRGTSRKGLSSLNSHDDIIRPLLAYPKAKLIEYAIANNLKWREDTTNSDQSYLRNYVRTNLVPRLDKTARAQLIETIERMFLINTELDDLIEQMIDQQTSPNHVDRQWFSSLPHNLAREVIAVWLRQNNIREFDKKTLERLVVAAKVANGGRTFPVRKGLSLEIKTKDLALNYLER